MSKSTLIKLSKKGRSLGLLTLGIGAYLVSLQSPATAIEDVVLTYGSDRVDVTISDMEQFAKTGELSASLQTFFATTEKVPTQWSSILTDTVQIPSFIESFLHSSNGRYILHQLDSVIDDSGSQTLVNLDKAIAQAMEDGSISMIEIIQDYPEDEVTIDLEEVESVYTEVKGIIQEVDQGDWEIAAQDFLQGVLCHCQVSSDSNHYLESDNSIADHIVTASSETLGSRTTPQCSGLSISALRATEEFH